MTCNEIAQQIVDASVKIHKALGPGLLESVYERVLMHELAQRGLAARAQVPIAFQYDGLQLDEGFRADLIVENRVIIELKSVERIQPVHLKQLKTYLVLADVRLGLLLNFGQELMRDGIKRVVNQLEE